MAPTNEGLNGLRLSRGSNGGISCDTSISNSTYTSSVFSTEEDNYDSRIKEIEEYYIKTLLNEDETAQEDFPSDDCLMNDQTKASVEYYQTLNDFKPTSFIEQLAPAQPLATSAAGHATAQLYRQKPKKNALEVEINRNLKPANDILPLTTENLERLTICADQSQCKGSAHCHIHRTTQPTEQPQLNKELYKTELCESFTTKGTCRYGNKCQFAHGLHELKFKPKSNNYRTKPCVNWAKYGYCPYGKRCCFKHGNDEDIEPYAKPPNGVNNREESDSFVKRKNLHANVKALQKITW